MSTVESESGIWPWTSIGTIKIHSSTLFGNPFYFLGPSLRGLFHSVNTIKNRIAWSRISFPSWPTLRSWSWVVVNEFCSLVTFHHEVRSGLGVVPIDSRRSWHSILVPCDLVPCFFASTRTWLGSVMQMGSDEDVNFPSALLQAKWILRVEKQGTHKITWTMNGGNSDSISNTVFSMVWRVWDTCSRPYDREHGWWNRVFFLAVASLISVKLSHPSIRGTLLPDGKTLCTFISFCLIAR